MKMQWGSMSMLFFVALIAATTSGCVATGHAFSDKELLATPVKIFFATDRNKTGKDDPNEYFGNTNRALLTYGTITVSVPKSHTRGVIERPKWYKFQFSENVTRDIVLIKPITEKDQESFFGDLRRDINGTERQELFIFIHGFYNSFQDAALRTAQIAYDVGYTGKGSAGVPVMYSWASTEEKPPLGYTRDKTRVLQTRPHLVTFINEVVQKTPARKINIIAHSMGTDLFGQVIADLASLANDGSIFNEIILAAPDIDQKVFEEQIAPKLTVMSKHTTLYCSSEDVALKASYEVNGARRIGDSTEGPFVMKGIETVDVGAVDFGLLGHSTFAEAREALQDMFLILVHKMPASKRNLQGMTNGAGMQYWTLPK